MLPCHSTLEFTASAALTAKRVMNRLVLMFGAHLRGGQVTAMKRRMVSRSAGGAGRATNARLPVGHVAAGVGRIHVRFRGIPAIWPLSGLRESGHGDVGQI